MSVYRSEARQSYDEELSSDERLYLRARKHLQELCQELKNAVETENGEAQNNYERILHHAQNALKHAPNATLRENSLLKLATELQKLKSEAEHIDIIIKHYDGNPHTLSKVLEALRHCYSDMISAESTALEVDDDDQYGTLRM